ncbi:MAG: hypothetical protein WC764_02290 [Candidatus Paceibacterota bacterium]
MLSETERTFINKLREDEVLRDIRRDLLTNFFTEGALLVACGDCERFWEAIDWLRNHTDGLLSQDKWRLQLCVFNGAPLHLSRKMSWEHKFILEQFSQTNSFKSIERVIVHGHGPCSAAGHMGLTLPQNLALTMHAREVIVDVFGLKPENVIALFHAHYRDKMRLYKIKRSAWKRATEENHDVRVGLHTLSI